VFEYTEHVYLLMTEEVSQLYLNAAEKFKHLLDQTLLCFELSLEISHLFLTLHFTFFLKYACFFFLQDVHLCEPGLI
jgi:hypothetical protein